MVYNVEAIYDHGVFRPIEPLALPEGTRVHLHVVEESAAEHSADEPAEGELPTLLERMKGFVGTVHNLPPDASVNLDHYLYGTPKRK
jgi:predicted DNA-binding antitoxin AbrB/MazE fold protein